MARYGEPNAVGQAASAATVGGAALAAGGAAYAAGKHGDVKRAEKVVGEREKSLKYAEADYRRAKKTPGFVARKNGSPDARFKGSKPAKAADVKRKEVRSTVNEARTAMVGQKKLMGRGVKTAIGGAGLALAGGGLSEYLRSRRIRQEREAGKSRFSEAFGALKAQHGAQTTPVRDKHKEIAALAPKRPPEGSRTFAENPETGKHEEQKSARVKAWEDSWRKQLGEDS